MPIQRGKRTIPETASHRYHAQAYVLSAELLQPVPADIKEQALVQLPEDGSYTYLPASPFQLYGVLSYRSGHTQVAGHPSSTRNGFVTLATSVLEDLNVLDVVTADRVVGQISTEHLIDEQVPSVTFLGTRFVNLRIGGQKVEVDQDLDILGPKPPKDRSYFDDSGVLSRISQQYAKIRNTKNLPDWADERFRWNTGEVQRQGEATFSIVNKVSGTPGTSFGHVIDLPDFGKIFLGELRIQRKMGSDSGPDIYTLGLTMIRLELGSLAHGTANLVHVDSNGGGSGGGQWRGAGPTRQRRGRAVMAQIAFNIV
jgi:hypothetical protein